MHRYPGAWNVDFSIFSQNDDGRKEECSLFLDEEVYDPLYSSECSETEPFLCSILQGLYYISLKEVRLHDIAQWSSPSECQMDFESSS